MYDARPGVRDKRFNSTSTLNQKQHYGHANNISPQDFRKDLKPGVRNLQAKIISKRLSFIEKCDNGDIRAKNGTLSYLLVEECGLKSSGTQQEISL
jgi:hypothetical protein